MPAASRRNRNEERHSPEDDNRNRDPAEDVESRAAEDASIEQADGEFQETKRYRVYEIEGGLQLKLKNSIRKRYSTDCRCRKNTISHHQLTLPSISTEGSSSVKNSTALS